MPDPIRGINASDLIGATSAAQTGTTQSSGTSAQPAAAAPVDQADVGGTETLLTTIAEAANDVPSIDEARVSALQQALAAGTFQVDPQKTAENMMRLESSLAAGGEAGGGGS